MAKKLVNDNKVKITDVNENSCYFEVDKHIVVLRLERIPSSRQYERKWSCDCIHLSLFSDNPYVTCKHIKAAELLLFNNI